ncbi:MAG: hypothetical protein ACLGI3_14265 [Actinomycetes bacterium]
MRDAEWSYVVVLLARWEHVAASMSDKTAASASHADAASTA